MGWRTVTLPSARKDGFLTPLFGVGALALGVIATAMLQLARTDAAGTARETARAQDAYAAEGVAMAAAWAVLHAPGETARTWSISQNGVTFAVTAEPEGRKLGLAEADEARGRERLQAWLGPEGAEVATRAAALAQRIDPAPSRAELAVLSRSAVWRRCGLTMLSAHSQLTDDALAGSVGAPPTGTAASAAADRSGQVWRIVVSRGGRSLQDRLIRFTGDPGAPVANLDELAGYPPPDGCAAQIAAERGAG